MHLQIPELIWCFLEMDATIVVEQPAFLSDTGPIIRYVRLQHVLLRWSFL